MTTRMDTAMTTGMTTGMAARMTRMALADSFYSQPYAVY